MKKIFLSLMVLLIVVPLSGCGKTETIKDTITQEKEIIIDYSSSTSFEKAINDKKEVKDKIVKVLIYEVEEKSNSLTKFKSGNNLIFSSNESVDISKNDYIVLKVIKESVKKDGNWIIDFEMIKVMKKESQIENSENNEEDSTDEVLEESKKIKLDRDSSDYVGLDKKEIEKEFKNKGFTNIELKETKTTDSKNKDNSIVTITINEKEFKKDEEFNKDDKILITYWKYEKPASEYEMAFIRDMSNYDLYYMFDIDNKKVVYFGTNDTYVDKGTYSGDFNSGVTINWSHGEWTEKFVNKNVSSSAMLTDGNGFEWKYEKCDVSKAQKILDSLE